MLEKASKSVWEMILDNNGLGKEITETVERVFCRLSGREPPLFPPVVESQSEKGKEKETEASGGKEQKRSTDNPDSSSKKRKLDEISKEEGTGEVAAPDDSSKMPHPSAKT